MSNPNENQDNDDDQGNKPDIVQVRGQLKRVEAENKELRATATAGQAATRELLLIKAGVNTDTPLGKLFAKGYEGPLELDAIRAAAIEATIIADPANDPQRKAEEGAVQRIADARTAGEQNVAVTDVETQINAAKSEAELEAIMARANAGKSV